MSDSVAALKKEVVGFLSNHMKASNLANDEGMHACMLDAGNATYTVVHKNDLCLMTSSGHDGGSGLR